MTALFRSLGRPDPSARGSAEAPDRLDPRTPFRIREAPHEPKHAARPRLRDVTDVRPRRRSRLVPFVVGIVLLALFGILYVHITAARSAFELAQIEKTVRAKQDQNEKLTVTKAYLEAPERIRREAIERLHMQAPVTVHYLPAEGVNGDGTTTPAGPDSVPRPPAVPQP